MDSSSQPASPPPEPALARRLPVWLLLAATLAAGHGLARADSGGAPADQVKALGRQIALLEQQLNTLRANQQALLEALAVADTAAAPAVVAPAAGDVHVAENTAAPAGDWLGRGDQRLSLSGDSRLRYENTSAYGDTPQRNRAVLRARLAAAYAFSDTLTLGARLATGDADDPNSSDITLGNFVDDLEVSLDQAYVRYQDEDVIALGGKFANPFVVARDLVWDADVNPQGLALGGRLFGDESQSLRITAAFTPIDNQVMDDDSYMTGLQLAYSAMLGRDWSMQWSGAYYDYSIGSLASADAGDIRDNRLTADGSAYLSDFDLVDTVASLHYLGLGSRLPLFLHADYVVNLGAYDAQDSAYELGARLGRGEYVGDWQFGYAYAEADIDAVLTAFSHDNTTFASNYRQHSLFLAYVPIDDVSLNMTAYHYRRDRLQPGYTAGWDDWVTRLRLNLSFQF